MHSASRIMSAAKQPAPRTVPAAIRLKIFVKAPQAGGADKMSEAIAFELNKFCKAAKPFLDRRGFGLEISPIPAQHLKNEKVRRAFIAKGITKLPVLLLSRGATTAKPCIGLGQIKKVVLSLVNRVPKAAAPPDDSPLEKHYRDEMSFALAKDDDGDEALGDHMDTGRMADRIRSEMDRRKIQEAKPGGRPPPPSATGGAKAAARQPPPPAGSGELATSDGDDDLSRFVDSMDGVAVTPGMLASTFTGGGGGGGGDGDEDDGGAADAKDVRMASAYWDNQELSL